MGSIFSPLHLEEHRVVLISLRREKRAWGALLGLMLAEHLKPQAYPGAALGTENGGGGLGRMRHRSPDERRYCKHEDGYTLLAGVIWKVGVAGSSLFWQSWGLPAFPPRGLPRIGQCPMDPAGAAEEHRGWHAGGRHGTTQNFGVHEGEEVRGDLFQEGGEEHILLVQESCSMEVSGNTP